MEAQSEVEPARRLHLWERWVNRDRGACPFGVCLRPTQGESDIALTFPHIRVGRITAEERRHDGVANDMAAIRRLYANASSPLDGLATF